MKKANNLPIRPSNIGINFKHEVDYIIDLTRKPKVIADETNNSEEDADKGIMNVDVIMPVIPIHKIKLTIPNDIQETVDKIKQDITKSVGIPPHQLGIEPEENDGGIGQGEL